MKSINKNLNFYLFDPVIKNKFKNDKTKYSILLFQIKIVIKYYSCHITKE